jgi:Ammonium Transporter Family
MHNMLSPLPPLLPQSPGVAFAVGVAAGILSALGFTYVTPYLDARIGLGDTCGIHNLHGMPGALHGQKLRLSNGICLRSFGLCQPLRSAQWRAVSTRRACANCAWMPNALAALLTLQSAQCLSCT